ncbi:hypothetical protein L873DRAFT_1198508 [Choiromyces venosus 120613-1]|uniref:Plastocyanin-like domain-containing protein n=1 Tax=Choiromyces venosus 120613-1 TaxID=1336337 RepID=A0A3N4JJA5_9PEZI|nr:hypothetical protein L873DRAFT_1198508 [Choiromyces venosus 120613-1]
MNHTIRKNQQIFPMIRTLAQPSLLLPLLLSLLACLSSADPLVLTFDHPMDLAGQTIPWRFTDGSILRRILDVQVPFWAPDNKNDLEGLPEGLVWDVIVPILANPFSTKSTRQFQIHFYPLEPDYPRLNRLTETPELAFDVSYDQNSKFLQEEYAADAPQVYHCHGRWQKTAYMSSMGPGIVTAVK